MLQVVLTPSGKADKGTFQTIRQRRNGTPQPTRPEARAQSRGGSSQRVARDRRCGQPAARPREQRGRPPSPGPGGKAKIKRSRARRRPQSQEHPVPPSANIGKVTTPAKALARCCAPGACNRSSGPLPSRTHASRKCFHTTFRCSSWLQMRTPSAPAPPGCRPGNAMLSMRESCFARFYVNRFTCRMRHTASILSPCPGRRHADGFVRSSEYGHAPGANRIGQRIEPRT